MLQDQPKNSTRTPAIVVYTHIVGTAVIRALAHAGVPLIALHYADNEVGYLSRYVTESICVPSLKENEAAFLSRVMKLGDRFPGAVLIPTDDYSLTTLSAHKRQLNTKYVVAADDWERVSECINKQHTYARAKALGIACPATLLVSSREDLQTGVEELRFPCLLKPTQGHKFQDLFGVKMFKADNSDQLAAAYDRAQAAGIEIMLQEIIPGSDAEGVNYNSYFVDGNPIAEFTAKKVRLEPPFFGSPRVIVSKSIPEIIEPGRALLRDLKYTGFSCMEFKRDIRSGVYTLMEVNCRNNRSGSLAVRCGINFPWIMYQHLVTGEITPHAGFRENVAWIEGTSDLVRFFVSHSAEKYSIREYIRPYLMKKEFAFFSFRDPLPFFKRTYFFARTAMKYLQRRLSKTSSSKASFPWTQPVK